MAATLQVLYPAESGTSFDMEYYVKTHLPMVDEYMGAHLRDTVVTKGLAGGPDTQAGYHAVATLIFEDSDALNAAMAVAGPVVEDIPNFTDTTPQMLIGETLG